jgi:hypothetical protein
MRRARVRTIPSNELNIPALIVTRLIIRWKSAGPTSVWVDGRRVDQCTVVRRAGVGIGVGKIKPVVAVTTGVTLARDALRVTHALVTSRYVGLSCDHDIRCLDECGRHTSFDVELSVAMEKPNSGVVGYEAKCNSHARIHNNNITSHGCRGLAIETRPLRFISCTVDDLELVTVEMEWMSASIMIVEVNLDDVSQVEELRVDLTVDLGVELICRWCCICGEERWDLPIK